MIDDNHSSVATLLITIHMSEGMFSDVVAYLFLKTSFYMITTNFFIFSCLVKQNSVVPIKKDLKTL